MGCIVANGCMRRVYELEEEIKESRAIILAEMEHITEKEKEIIELKLEAIANYQ